MFKKMILALTSLASISGPAIAVSSNLTTKTEQKYGQTIEFDGKFFSTQKEILLYYLKTHPNIINHKQVVGNISQSIIDANYNMLNHNSLYDYDPNQIKPAYHKSSGQLTSNYETARTSYANPIFIREKFQGSSADKTFSTKSEAIRDRAKNLLTINQGYLKFKDPLTKNDIKYNPLNEIDYQYLKKNLIQAIKNSDTVPLTSIYKKTFDVKEFDARWQSDKNKFSYLNTNGQKTKEPQIEPLDVASTQANKGDESLSVENTEKTYQESFSFEKLAEKNKGYHDGWNGFVVSFKFFDGIDASNGKNDIYMETESDDDGGMGDDSIYNDAWFIKEPIDREELEKKENYKIFESQNIVDIEKLIAPYSDEAKITVEAKDLNDGGIEKYIPLDLNRTRKWTHFIEEARKKIQEAHNFWGSNIKPTLLVKIDTRSKDKSTNFITHYKDDTWGATNRHYLKTFYTEFLSYHLKIEPDLKTNNILVNFNKKFDDILNYQIANNSNYNYSAQEIFDNWIKEPYTIKDNNVIQNINEYDLAILNKIKDSILEKDNSNYLYDYLKTIKEYISFNNNKNNYKAFKMLRNNKSNNVNKDNNDDKFYDLEILDWSIKENKIKTIVDLISKNNVESFISSNDLINIFTYLNNDSSNSKSQQDYNKLATSFNNLKISKFNNYAQGGISSLHSIIDLLTQYLNEIKKYLRINYQYEEKANGKIKLINNQNTKKYFENNVFLKNAKFNINHLLIMGKIENKNVDDFLLKNSLIIKGSSIDSYTGKYLLLNDGLFNSSFVTNEVSNQVGPDGIYTIENKYNQYYKIAISADPPIVRVMYNIDGDVIVGQGVSLTNQNNHGVPIYDDEEVFLQNAYFQADVKTDHNYVYYIDQEQLEHLLLYQVSSIYTLNIPNGHKENKSKDKKDSTSSEPKYFKSHEGLLKYLQDYLMSQETIYS